MRIDTFVVTIEGETGSGKTELWQSFLLGLQNSSYKSWEVSKVGKLEDVRKETYKIEILR